MACGTVPVSQIDRGIANVEHAGMYTREGEQADTAPRDSATVILLRDRPGGPYEVFLMRRHRKQAFMGGAHVFPGGSLDDDDRHPGLAPCIDGLSAADARRLLQEPDLPELTAFGLFLAAIRETFEEAGVLLARDNAGQVVDLTDPATAARFAAYRLELHEGDSPWRALPNGNGYATPPTCWFPIRTGSHRRSNPAGSTRASSLRGFRKGRPPSTTAWS